jgi:hypothetical protein
MIQETIQKAIGRKLFNVFGSYYFKSHEFDETPLSIWLYFESISPIRFLGDSNGWNISLDEKEPEPIDMGEAGEICIRDLSQKPIFKSIIHQELKSVSTFDSPDEGNIIGFRLDFGVPGKLIILNWGDELYIGEKVPPDFESDEIIEVKVITNN